MFANDMQFHSDADCHEEEKRGCGRYAISDRISFLGGSEGSEQSELSELSEGSELSKQSEGWEQAEGWEGAVG